MVKKDQSELEILISEYAKDFEVIAKTQFHSEENHLKFLEKSSDNCGYKPDFTLEFMMENKIKYIEGVTHHFHEFTRYAIESRTYNVGTANLYEFIKLFAYVEFVTADVVRGVLKDTIFNLVKGSYLA